MKPSFSFAQVAVACGLLAPAMALPAPQMTATASAPPELASGPPSASGSPRGPASLLGYSPGNPVGPGESTEIPPSEYQLAPGQTENANLGLYLDLSTVENPQPIRGPPGNSPTDPGPRNYAYDRINSDVFAPPATDSGALGEARWPFGLSHNRHGKQGSGWARNQNTDQLPIALQMAGVDMRLSPHAYRELHWHVEGEWSLILNGSVRLSAMNEAGETFVDDLEAGDVWFFPPGIPHSIQAKEDGAEFLLVFNAGDFSEENTFLVSEMMERNPQTVLAKNFRTDASVFDPDNLPDGQLWIFPGTPMPQNISEQNVTGPAGSIPLENTYSYHFSQQEPYKVPGGSVKIIDPLTFPIASNFSAALFTVEPGAMRELHWHTVSDEWSYFIKGTGRLTAYQAPSSSRTWDFNEGDVGYVPDTFAHYIENTGTEDLIYLEVLQADTYNDISVNQWLGLTPKQVVKDHFPKLPDSVINNLPKTKPYLVPGNPNMTTTNFTGNSI